MTFIFGSAAVTLRFLRRAFAAFGELRCEVFICVLLGQSDNRFAVRSMIIPANPETKGVHAASSVETEKVGGVSPDGRVKLESQTLQSDPTVRQDKWLSQITNMAESG